MDGSASLLSGGKIRGAHCRRWPGRDRSGLRLVALQRDPVRPGGRLPVAAAVGAVVLFSASLAPSLLPRPWQVQAFVSGAAIAIGYGFGEIMSSLVPPAWRGRVSQRWSRRLRSLALAPALVLALAAAVVHYRWQLDIRRLMGMDSGVAPYLVAAMIASLPVGLALLGIAHLLGQMFRGYVRLLQRWVSRGPSLAIASLTTLLLVGVIGDVVIADRLLTRFNESYLAADGRFDDEVEQPTSPFLAGSPSSLIEWETMGNRGRAFVADAVGTPLLEDFNGEAASEPIRVYVGLRSADTAADRAKLALAELERVGAFDRQVILLIAPTGTGWIDPNAVDPVEYMYNGDTAAVAIQYSHLPSWVVMIGNQDVAIEASRALFEAVRERLQASPASSRPRLLLYGQSLGSFGLEAIFDGLDDAAAKADGVLWVGPPASNRLWQDAVAHRDPDSPVWLPVYEGGVTVRFGADGLALSEIEGPWIAPRIAYLQHASDPITWLSSDLLFERPEWMDEPRGRDVSPEMGFIPVVTFWQVVVDLVIGTSAPPGHGHRFGAAQAEAWSLILPPLGWSSPDTARLVTVLDEAG